LILGAPRSGTSWLGKIFDSHPDVLYRHEPDIALREPRLPLIIRTEDSAQYTDIAAAYLDRLLSASTIKATVKLPVFAKSYRPWALGLLYQAMVQSARLLAGTPATDRFGAIGLPDLFKVDRHPQLRFVMKTVTALGRVGVFLRAVPTMRVIFLLRHPGGQVASMLRGMRLGKMQTLDGLTKVVARNLVAARYGLSSQSLAKASPVDQWAWHWVIMNELALEALAAQGRGRTCVVTYEDICCDPIGWAKVLFDFGSLRWNHQTEKFINRSIQGQRRESYYGVFHSPAEVVNRWRLELDTCDRQAITDILQQTELARYWPDESGAIGGSRV